MLKSVQCAYKLAIFCIFGKKNPSSVPTNWRFSGSRNATKSSWQWSEVSKSPDPFKRLQVDMLIISKISPILCFLSQEIYRSGHLFSRISSLEKIENPRTPSQRSFKFFENRAQQLWEGAGGNYQIRLNRCPDR